MRRGELRRVILETVIDVASFPADMFVAVVAAGYGASARRLGRKLDAARSSRKELGAFIKNRASFYNTLQRLKRDGLIEKTQKGWIITQTGKSALNLIKSGTHRKDYSAEKSESTIIVIFDIPEHKRGVRDWLRDSLKHMGFKMIQKSVWSAKLKLPREFINDLDRLGAIKHVDIFKAVKLGSLR